MNGLLPDDNFLVLARPRPGQEQELPQCTLPPFDPSKPLPDYTRSWGDQLRRPTKLPDHYDTRIDPNHIFLFAVHPVTGIERDFYVTPKPCEYCARIRQVCSRSRPSCQRCTISGDPDRVCHVEDGWVKLPGPKCEKPKLQKRPMVRLGGKTVGTRGSSPSGTVPAPKRTRTIAPHPIDESLSSLSSTPTLSNSNHYEPMSIPKKPLPKRAVPITLSENGKAVSPAQSISAKALVGNAKKKGPPPKIDRRKGKKAGKKSTVNESSKEPEDERWIAEDGTIWRIVRPPPRPPRTSAPPSLVRLLHEEPVSTRIAPAGKPRIWAKNKSELLEILPELSGVIGENGPGLYVDETSLEPPIVFLEGNAWPEDSLTVDSSAEISFVRDFTIPTERTRLASGKPVDFDDDGEMMLVDELPGEQSTITTPSLASSRSQSAPEAQTHRAACHPTQLLSTRPQPQATTIASSSRLDNGHSAESRSSSILHTFPPIERPSANSKSPPIASSSYFSSALGSNSSSNWSAPRPAEQRGTARPSLRGAFSGKAIVAHQGSWPSPVSRPPPPLIGAGGQCQHLSSSLEFAKFAQDTLGNVKFKLRPAEFTPSDSAGSDDTQDSDGGMGDSLLGNMYRRSGSPRHNSPSKRLPANEFIDKIDSLNRGLIAIVPPEAHKRLARAQKISEYRSNFIPKQLPLEITHLLECKTYSIPLALIVSHDYTPLPFRLPEDCGICFLGFYKILDIERKLLLQHEDEEQRTIRATWHVKLRWTPGGENAPDDCQPKYPWWKYSTFVNTSDPAEPSPYSLLPVHLRSDFAKPVSESNVASEVYTGKGWHCTHCGLLNVQRLLGFQRCSTCQAGNDMLPVDAMYVRDPHKTTPDSTPVDTYPESVSRHIIDGDRGGTRTFVYVIDGPIEIKHVFTCNRPAMQKQANRLFLEMQRHVPMAWQGAKTKLATGPYFTYLVGVGHEPSAFAVPWSQVPACVREARELMETVGMQKAEEELKVDSLTILGWHSSGSRKSHPLPSKGKPVAMLCLGADVELRVAPISGFFNPPRNGIKRSESVVARQAQRNISKAHDHDWDPFGSPLSGSSDEEALAVRHNGVVTGAAVRNKAKKSSETMLITLVHGDMIIFCGDDFEYTLHRTGMSIVLIGMPHGPKGR